MTEFYITPEVLHISFKKNKLNTMKKNLFILLIIVTKVSFAQTDAAELAKKLSNPISSLISVPFQNNTDYGIGKFNGTRNTLNIQPVVPISLSKKLNLVTRLIMPVVTQYNITGAGERQSGLSDFVLSAFFSPSESKNGVTWGAGPVFLLPLGTNDFLTAKKFGIGPTAIILKQSKGVTYGALVNQIWSVAGSNSRPNVNQMFLQPFLTYNWKSGAGIGGGFEWTQNWNAGTTTLWFIPTISGVTGLGKQKVQLAVGPRFNLAAPNGSKADLGWRASLVFLFPK
jgi:hypothetical protein